MEKCKVGILGNGFVGQAIGNAFALTNPVFVYDKDEARRTNTLSETIDNSDIIFVCVPTPMKVSKNNKIDLSIVHSLFEEVENLNTDDSSSPGSHTITSIPAANRIEIAVDTAGGNTANYIASSGKIFKSGTATGPYLDGYYLSFTSAPPLDKPITVLHNFDK